MPDAACPICHAPSNARLRPFCSPRCADVDLGRWITGQYVVAGTETADEDSAAPQEADPA